MSRKHTHKYHKVETSAGDIWACALPDCSHFMPTHFTEMLPGKFSICWECNEQFILTKENMKNNQPICPDCEGLTHIGSAIEDRLNQTKE